MAHSEVSILWRCLAEYRDACRPAAGVPDLCCGVATLAASATTLRLYCPLHHRGSWLRFRVTRAMACRSYNGLLVSDLRHLGLSVRTHSDPTFREVCFDKHAMVNGGDSKMIAFHGSEDELTLSGSENSGRENEMAHAEVPVLWRHLAEYGTVPRSAARVPELFYALAVLQAPAPTVWGCCPLPHRGSLLRVWPTRGLAFGCHDTLLVSDSGSLGISVRTHSAHALREVCSKMRQTGWVAHIWRLLIAEGGPLSRRTVRR